MRGHDLTIVVKVSTKPQHGSDYLHFMTVRDALAKALAKLVKDEKIHDTATIVSTDGDALELADQIFKTIDTKVEARATQLEDDYKDRIRDLKRGSDY